MNHEKDERENQPEGRQREDKSSDEVVRHSQWMI
jgi:hypothetical protein